jgi:hypothetical protein
MGKQLEARSSCLPTNNWEASLATPMARLCHNAALFSHTNNPSNPLLASHYVY